MSCRAAQKYLKTYAEKETQIADLLATTVAWDHAVIVPCLGERQTLPYLLSSLASAAAFKGRRLLAIVIINGTEQSQASDIAENAQTVNWLRESLAIEKESDNPCHYFVGSWNELCSVLTLDVVLPVEAGVGLARKIGCDLAVALWQKGVLRNPWAFSIDADVVVPLDYFNIESCAALGAGVVLQPFVHQIPDFFDSSKRQAVVAYDQYLRYYPLGLAYSGSPYAYYSIGSTISFLLNHYAAVRGFPNRQAGEDFYFLNKMRKVTSFAERQGEPLQIAGRFSSRTPFGTGQAVAKISQRFEQGLSYSIYHPATFVALKMLFAGIDAFFEQGCEEALREVAARHLPLLTKTLADFPIACDFGLGDILDSSKSFGGIALLRKIAAMHPDVKKQRRFFADYFDAQKTLKWVHYLRDNYLGTVSHDTVFSGNGAKTSLAWLMPQEAMPPQI